MHLATITEAEVDNDGVLSAGDNIRNKCHNGGTPMVTAACGASSSASDAAAVDVNIRLADCNTIGVAGNVSLNNEHRKSDTELKPLSNSSVSELPSRYVRNILAFKDFFTAAENGSPLQQLPEREK